MIASFNRFEIEFPVDAVHDCSGGGDATEAVTYWANQIDLTHISDEALVDELSEYGAWSDDELSDRDENELRIVWIGACDIAEAMV